MVDWHLSKATRLGCLLLQVVLWVFWTDSGPTSLQDMHTASGGGSLGQLSLALHVTALTKLGAPPPLEELSGSHNCKGCPTPGLNGYRN